MTDFARKLQELEVDLVEARDLTDETTTADLQQWIDLLREAMDMQRIPHNGPRPEAAYWRAKGSEMVGDNPTNHNPTNER